jgi:hypothetical protein
MNSLESVGVYVNNVLGTVLGKKEGFYDSSGGTISFAEMGAYALITSVLMLILLITNCYGAARLSWCYNTFYGVGEGEKLLWAILCFFFPGFYYPFYATSLDPVCGRVAQKGGKRKV